MATETRQLYEMADCRHGRFLYNRNDQFIGQGLSLYGEWSEAEVGLFRQVVQEGDVVIEAGANIGTHTVLLSRAAGPGGKILAFEAARHTHQLLCANVALNQCTNVHAVHKAIGRANGVGRFPLLDPHAFTNFGAASMRDAQSAAVTEEVEIQSIDALDLARLDFIKADIEGWELEMLEGAKNTLATLRPVCYLEIDCSDGRPTGNRDELVAFLDQYGYEAYYFVTPMFNPANFRGETRDVYGAVSVDLICVPAGIAAIDGLTRARVGDSAIHIQPGWLKSDVLPWSGARFQRSGPSSLPATTS